MRIRASTKLRNDKMIAARERLGLNQTRAAKEAGLSPQAWMEFEKLCYSRYTPETLERHASTISLYLGIPAEDIAPRELWGSEIPSTHKVVRTVETRELLEAVRNQQQHYLLAEPSTEMEQEEAHEVIDGVLETLTFQEREIIKLRFGLTDEHCYTLEEISRLFKVGRSRVLAIEAKALRKLGHPARSQKLAPLFCGEATRTDP